MFFSLYAYSTPLTLHSFPTRRSSDLIVAWQQRRRHRPRRQAEGLEQECPHHQRKPRRDHQRADKVGHNRPPESKPFDPGEDRKSTRLNSSHVSISYAVFCLKKTIRVE